MANIEGCKAGTQVRERRDFQLDVAIQGMGSIVSALIALQNKINGGDQPCNPAEKEPPRLTPPLRLLLEDGPVIIRDNTNAAMSLIQEIEDSLF